MKHIVTFIVLVNLYIVNLCSIANGKSTTTLLVKDNNRNNNNENIIVEKATTTIQQQQEPSSTNEKYPSLIDLSSNMHGPGGKCLNFTPTFCDMIDYKVAAARLHAIDNTELAIEMNFYNQPGTWACRKEYKEFQCRIMFPTCTATMHVVPPCKKSCDEFALRCPGSDVACDALTDDPEQCYKFDYWKEQAANGNYGKGALTLKGWPSALIGGVVLLCFLIFAKSSDDKKRKKEASLNGGDDMENRPLMDGI